MTSRVGRPPSSGGPFAAASSRCASQGSAIGPCDSRQASAPTPIASSRARPSTTRPSTCNARPNARSGADQHRGLTRRERAADLGSACQGFALPVDWPAPADPDAAERLIERFAALGRAQARLARQPPFGAMLRAIGGNSPYLSDLALREAALLRSLAADGPDPAVAAIMLTVAATPPTTARPKLAALLRQAKRQLALAVAIADIGGVWTLEQVTGALSRFAEAALALAAAHLLRAGHDAGELRLPDPAEPERNCGFTVLGMGKLGAGELNYSSDIDLVLLYDPDAHAEPGEGLRALFSRFARNLVAIMEARDADGYVFRTDLRLRPDPAATPPAIALPAAISYYESMGQNWERAAMIKARPVAGDRALGAEFLAAIRPFVWRRHLDFAAIGEIHLMKRRIDEQQKSARALAGADPVARIAGHNVKLGLGGIREIEFLTQTLELVWGGRDPALREPRTLPALRLLARAGHLPKRAAAELASAYRFLRRVEHRLQMVADRQTHSLPTKPEELAAFAAFMGHADARGFAVALLRQHRPRPRPLRAAFRVRAGATARRRQRSTSPARAKRRRRPSPRSSRSASAIRRASSMRCAAGVPAGCGRSAPSGRASCSEACCRCCCRRSAGSASPTRPSSASKPSLPGCRRACSSSRCSSATPRCSTASPPCSAPRPRSPTISRRCRARSKACCRRASLVRRTRCAPSRPPSPMPSGSSPRSRSSARPCVGRSSGSTSRCWRDACGIDEAGAIRTALADAAIAALLPRVVADFAERNGSVRGGGMVVVALGKCGGREMLAGSDLDLMLVYDHPATVTESRGARSLPVSQYYIRAAHAFVAALTAPGPEGALYAVDMRLRPSGNKGPVAVSLGGFRRYHAEDAWTWERMALIRARVVAGPRALGKRVEAAIRDAILAADPARVREDARAMRGRLARDLPPGGPWDVKLRPGGLMEVEFVAQALALVHARVHPEILSPTTRVALARLRDAGLLDPADAALLIRADTAWRGVQGILRLVLGRAMRGDPPPAALAALAQTVGGLRPGEADLPSLRAALDSLAAEVRAAFTRLVGDPEIKP